MRIRSWTALAVATAMVVLGAGCGGDDDEGASGDASMTRAAFVAKGDAICAAGREEIASRAQAVLSAKGNRSDLETELVSATLIPVLESEVDDLRALEVPSGDEEEVEQILVGFEEVIEEARLNPSAFLGSATALPSDPWREADKQAEEYGFEECPRS